MSRKVKHLIGETKYKQIVSKLAGAKLVHKTKDELAKDILNIVLRELNIHVIYDQIAGKSINAIWFDEAEQLENLNGNSNSSTNN